MQLNPQRLPPRLHFSGLLTALATASLVILCALLPSADEPGAPPPATPTDAPANLTQRLDRGVERGVAFLLSRQQPDGSWISTQYGSFKDEMALTPLMTKILFFAPTTAATYAARDRAVAYLAGRVKADGRIDESLRGINYPVYSAALTVIVLSLAGDKYFVEREAWLRYLRQFQYTEARGWSPNDASYGGWGYSPRPVVRAALRGASPEDADAMQADISSTIFAIGALRFAETPLEDPAYMKALRFFEGRQNWHAPAPPGLADPPNAPPGSMEAQLNALDDGGFSFSPVPALNKAGYVEVAGRATLRHFNSYGSATADGLRGLVRSGLPSTHPRVLAARGWLEKNFRSDRHPGEFVPGLAADRDAFYYYAWSISHSFNALNIDQIPGADGQPPIDWADQFAAELLRRQRPDGAWSNPATFMREDDPMLATPLALATLLIARLHLSPTAGPAAKPATASAPDGEPESLLPAAVPGPLAGNFADSAESAAVEPESTRTLTTTVGWIVLLALFILAAELMRRHRARARA